MSESKKERIVRIINSLREKTTERGATEEEAFEAASKIAALMDQYDIAEKDLESDDDSLYEGIVTVDKLWQELLLKLIAGHVAALTGTVAVSQRTSARKRNYSFIGEDADVTFATWLAKAIVSFILSGLRFEETGRQFVSAGSRSAYRNGYLIGAGERIRERIKEILDQRNRTRSSANLPVVMNKSLVIREKIQDKIGKLGGLSGGFHGRADGAARASGRLRGQAVQLTRGIHGDQHSPQSALPKS